MGRFVTKVSITLFFVSVPTMAASAGEWIHERDVVYGYKDGMALVMDVFTPNVNRNGAGVIRMMSGGMSSSPQWSHVVTQHRAEVRNLLGAGYVVFAVAHSSQPKYTIDEIFPDTTRAVRFIRHSAERFGVDPLRIGIMGASSGGHLSLLVATAAPEANAGATDPVDRESSRVQAVVSYYAGTDNLNFGRANMTIADHFRLQGNPTAEFDFRKLDTKSKRFERVTDPELIRTLFRDTSPVTHVDSATPPILIFHGDDDKLVPLQQSEVLVARLQQAGVPHKLVVVKGKGHGYSNGWKTPVKGELSEIRDWFDRHLIGLKKVNITHGVELHYVERGQGDPVIFIHGGLEDYSLWMDQVCEFGKNYRAIAYSRRYNFPNSNSVRTNYSAAQEAEDLAGLIQKLKLGRCHIVGFSYGGTTALFLAVRHPELVRTLTLAEPALVPWLAELSPPYTDEGKAVLAEYNSQFVEKAKQKFAEGDADGALRVTLNYLAGEGVYDDAPPTVQKLWKRNAKELKAIFDAKDGLQSPAPDDVQALEAPIMLLSGEKSGDSCKLVVAELEKLLSIKRKELSGATHAMWIQKPQQCRGLVLEFLGEN